MMAPISEMVFDSRAGLFDALAADLLQGGGFERMMSATTHPNPVEGLREVIRGGARMFATHRVRSLVHR
jgi:hypothetical protein